MSKRDRFNTTNLRRVTVVGIVLTYEDENGITQDYFDVERKKFAKTTSLNLVGLTRAVWGVIPKYLCESYIFSLRFNYLTVDEQATVIINYKKGTVLLKKCNGASKPFTADFTKQYKSLPVHKNNFRVLHDLEVTNLKFGIRYYGGEIIERGQRFSMYVKRKPIFTLLRQLCDRYRIKHGGLVQYITFDVKSLEGRFTAFYDVNTKTLKMGKHIFRNLEV